MTTPANAAAKKVLDFLTARSKRGGALNDLSEALERTDSPMAIVASGLRLVSVNKAGQQELDNSLNLRVIAGHLNETAAPAVDSSLKHAVESGLRGLNMSLVTIGTAQPQTIAILPFANGSGEPLVLLSFERSDPPALALHLYARQHRLSMAESRVLEALAEGTTPNEIASQLSVKISTIRTHISAIRAKTNADSVRELLRKISHLPSVAKIDENHRLLGTDGDQAVASASISRPPAASSRAPEGLFEREAPLASELGDDEIAATALWMLGPSIRNLVMDTRLALHDALVQGLPSDTFESFCSRLTVLDIGVVEQIVGCSRKSSKASSERLSSDESAKLWHLTEALVRTSSFLGGQRRAEAWLATPAIGLNGRKPLDMLSTSVGIMLLDEFLRRIEYGVMQ